MKIEFLKVDTHPKYNIYTTYFHERTPRDFTIVIRLNAIKFLQDRFPSMRLISNFYHTFYFGNKSDEAAFQMYLNEIIDI
jgi:hypothetical protein